mgnify:CR=1 FL=1|tara:strand:+ start:288 stop:464 length:177 start_codon:yes stop_codon:yes gene_type:complete
MFQISLSRFQVETASEQFQSPIKEKAEVVYEQYVRENVPCEFYIDGKVIKQHKPLINT